MFAGEDLLYCGYTRRDAAIEKLEDTVKNKFKVIALIQISIVLIFCINCQPAAKGSNSTAVSSNSNAVNQPANSAVTLNATASNAATDTPAGSLATPTETYKTAYALRERKDTAGLKKVMAPDMIEFLTMVGEEEKKSLDDMIKEMFQKPQANTAEARNEKIKGDRATIEYLSETGAWKVMDFQKIDNQWKIAFPKADKGTE
jgi:hypothetical protein